MQLSTDHASTLASARAGRSHIRWYLLFFVAVFIALSIYSLHRSYQLHIEEAKYQTRLAGSSGSQLVSRLIGHLDILFPMINDLLIRLPQTDDYPAQVRDILLARQRENPYLMDLLVISPQGAITHWTGDGPPPAVMERAYVTAHLAADPPTQRYLGPPQLSKVHLGEWFFAISQAVRDGRGELQRILVAIIDIAYVHDLLFALDRPEGGAFVLASSAGLVYSRVPDHAQTVGRELPQVEEAVLTGERQMSGLMQSPLDNQQHAYTITRTDQTGLVFIATLSLDKLLARWWQALLIPLTILAGVLLLIAWLFVRLQQGHRQLVQLGAYDPQSGLYNRTTFIPLAQAELARARRYPRALSLIVIDLDHFKRINDLFGNAVGDQVISTVGALLRNYTRHSDICCRLGSDEFVVLVPETRLLGAMELADQLRQEICAVDMRPKGAALALAASFGVAELQPNDDLDVLLSRADQALHRSKQGGRNRISSSR